MVFMHYWSLYTYGVVDGSKVCRIVRFPLIVKQSIRRQSSDLLVLRTSPPVTTMEIPFAESSCREGALALGMDRLLLPELPPTDMAIEERINILERTHIKGQIVLSESLDFDTFRMVFVFLVREETGKKPYQGLDATCMTNHAYFYCTEPKVTAPSYGHMESEVIQCFKGAFDATARGMGPLGKRLKMATAPIRPEEVRSGPRASRYFVLLVYAKEMDLASQA